MLGTWEIILIVLVILLIFGGKKIPELMRGLGKGIRSFKDGMNEKEEKEPDELKLIWKDCLKRFIFTMLINSVLCIAIMAIMYYFGQPIIESMVPAE